MQVVAALRWRCRRAPTPDTVKNAQAALFHSVETAEPEHYVRGQYDGYRSIDGVDPELDHRDVRGAAARDRELALVGVPFFIRTGKRLPVTQTELRLVFKRPPRLGFAHAAGRRGEPARRQAGSLDGDRLDRRRAPRRPGGPAPITLDMEFAEEGGEGPTPYEVLLHAALVGRRHALHPSGRRRGGVARHAAAPRRAAARASLRAGHRGGPRRRTSSSPATAAGTDPGSRADRQRERSAMGAVKETQAGPRRRARPRRRRSRRSRTTRFCPTATPERSSRPTARSTGCAFPASTRRASSAACSTARRASSASPRSGSPTRRARAYVPGTNVFETTWKTPTGWVVVRDALTHGPRDHEDTITPAHAASGRRRRRPHARADGRVPRRPRRGRARLRAGLRLRPDAGHLDDGRRTAHAADATGAGVTFRLVSDLAIDVEGEPVRGRHVLEAGERAYCALSWAEELAAPQTSDEADGADRRDDALLAEVARPARGSRTTACATRCSGRRSRSRA